MFSTYKLINIFSICIFLINFFFKEIIFFKIVRLKTVKKRIEIVKH